MSVVTLPQPSVGPDVDSVRRQRPAAAQTSASGSLEPATPLRARRNGRRAAPAIARVRLDREGSAIVADALREAFVGDLEATAGELGAAPNDVSPRTLDALAALVERHRDALDLLAWGQATAEVEFVADPMDLRRLAGGLLQSGYELIGNAEAYVGSKEGCASAEQVIRRGMAEAGVGRIILDAVGER